MKNKGGISSPIHIIHEIVVLHKKTAPPGTVFRKIFNV